jgi:hypothetical protein
LGVSLWTVQHWDAGRCRVPWPVIQLLWLRRLGDVGALDPSCEQAWLWREAYNRGEAPR